MISREAGCMKQPACIQGGSMGKENYEKIRVEVAKKYRDRILELELENEELRKQLAEEREARESLENRLESAFQQACSFPGLLKVASSVLGSHAYGEEK